MVSGIVGARSVAARYSRALNAEEMRPVTEGRPYNFRTLHLAIV